MGALLSIQSGWKNSRKWRWAPQHSLVGYRYWESQDVAHKTHGLGAVFSVQSGWKNSRKWKSGQDHLHWDVHTGEQKKTLTGHTDWVRGIAFSPDGKTLVSRSGDGSVLLWEIKCSIGC